VINDAVESRIHLVVDTVGGGDCWELVARGRPHNVPPAGWPQQAVPPRANEVAAFACETVNVPVVMSPWELNAHFGLLFADAEPHPQLQQVRQASMRFARVWQGLWFEYGERAEGRARYRDALQRFIDEVKGPSQTIRLRNELRWFNAMMTIVAKFAVGSEAPATGNSAEQQRAVGDNA
jgi:hypothetical protein